MSHDDTNIEQESDQEYGESEELSGGGERFDRSKIKGSLEKELAP